MSVFTFQYSRTHGQFKDEGLEAWKAVHSRSGHNLIAMKKSHLEQYLITYLEFVKIVDRLHSQKIPFVIRRAVLKDCLQPGQEITSTFCTEAEAIHYFDKNIKI